MRLVKVSIIIIFKHHMQKIFLKRTKYLILSMLLLSNTHLWAIQVKIPIRLKWVVNNGNVHRDIPYEQFISFENAKYGNNQTDAVPFYQERLNLQGATNISVKIVSIKTINKGNIEKTNLKSIRNDFFMNWQMATEKKMQWLLLEIVPAKLLPGNNAELLEAFDIVINYDATPVAPAIFAKKSFKDNSVLANGNWYKINVSKTGIHKITKAQLISMGIDAENIDPRTIKIFGNGPGMLPTPASIYRNDDLQENPILVNGEQDGKLDDSDEILFYGKSQFDVWRYDSSSNRYAHETNLYSDITSYFITYGGVQGKRIQSSASITPGRTSNTCDYLFFHEKELVNLIKSGKRFMGEEFSRNLTQSFNVNISNLVSSEPVFMRSSVVARSFTSSNFTVRVNGSSIISHNISPVTSSYEAAYASDGDGFKSATFTSGSPNVVVEYTYNQPIPGSLGWLDYFEIQARSALVFNNGQLYFRDKNSYVPNVATEFNIQANADAVVWDVTIPYSPSRVSSSFSANTIKFVAEGDTIREFVVFNGSYHEPTFAGKIANQNLHNLTQADYIIVSPENLLSEANRLAYHHRNKNNLKVHVVTTSQIFNEFSSGVQDITAIRDFMRMFYKRATGVSDMPKSLLLFGRASYDYKNRVNNNTNLVPTFESWQSFHPVYTYCSDDFFGLLDDNEGKWDTPNDIQKELLDIGIGRLPATDLYNATVMVNKIINYTESPEWGDWMNRMAFVSDDEDNNIHDAQANIMADFARSNFKNHNIQKIFIDAYKEETVAGGARNPQAQADIVRSVERGCLLFNYTGHGGEVGLASERILTVEDINRWSNGGKLPLMVTATCEFSRYDDPSRFAAGELALLNANGGAIGLFTTVRLVNSGSNFALNQYFYSRVGLDSASAFIPAKSIGEIMRLTKNDYYWNDKNERNFTLLGDPAMFLARPEHRVATVSINNIPINAGIDTLKAFAKITISGRIVDLQGNPVSSFNGVVYPTVFDKASTYRTLVNNPSGYRNAVPFVFTMQNNVIYRGKASVNNGLFTFSFVVPKDISYEIDYGRISYYAENGQTDATGHFNEIVVGGTADSILADNQGPAIQLYLNDEKFVFGGLTNQDPLLIAKISDENGINITNRGIGRDIVQVMNNENTNSQVMNDYFQAKLDSYQEGEVRYKMRDLPAGKHTMKFSAWDVYNNYGESTLDFVVAKDEQAALQNVLNYPNPFTTSTTFHFDHNKPGIPITVLLQIFTISGKLVKTMRTETVSEGNHFDQLTWDGRDEYGDNIGKGVYVYKVKLKSQDGKTAEEFQKLVILN